MDDMSVKVWSGVLRGCMAKKCAGRRRRRTSSACPLRAAQRRAMSYVPCVCDDPTVQPMLPPGPRDEWPTCAERQRPRSSAMAGRTGSSFERGRMHGVSLKSVASGSRFELSMYACPTRALPQVIKAVASMGLHPADSSADNALDAAVRRLRFFAPKAANSSAVP